MLKLLFREEPASSHSQQLYALLQLRKQKKQVFNLYLESLWAKGEVKQLRWLTFCNYSHVCLPRFYITEWACSKRLVKKQEELAQHNKQRDREEKRLIKIRQKSQRNFVDKASCPFWILSQWFQINQNYLSFKYTCQAFCSSAKSS